MKPLSDLFRDTALALSLLTRLPIKLSESAYQHTAQAVWAYPLVGLVTGIIACFTVWLAHMLGLPLWAGAVFGVASGILVTGAMHEDGLADCADGFWGGWDPAMRLKIMQDSQIGTYGVLALIVMQGLRFGAILEILRWDNWALALIAVHVASRALMPMVMHTLPHARETGLSKSVGVISLASTGIAAGIGGLALLLVFGTGGVIPALIVLLITFGVIRLARVKIGGQTGDVCGASQQVAEITLLLALISG